MKKVLIIAYHYPPMVRVGGRRWHLFVKYLMRKGAEVDVLTCQEGPETTGDFGENIYRISPEPGPLLPYYKRHLPSNLIQKLRWHASKRLDCFHSKWKPADDRELSVHLTGAFRIRATELIQKNGYDTVVLTVGPFSYAGILPDLRSASAQQGPKPTYREPEHPDGSPPTFVLDYRDDWLRDRPFLSPRQKRGELGLERAALHAADLVTTVDESIAAIIQKAHPGLKVPVKVVPHGYDEDDFEGLLPSPPPAKGSKIKLVYGGACYAEVARYYDLFKDFFAAQKELDLEVDFYFTYLADEVAEVIAPLEPKCLCPPVSRHEMLRIHMEEADVNLIIYPDYAHNSQTSKFYELLRCGKPIWYFGPDGKTAAFLRQSGLARTFTTPADITALPGDVLAHPPPSTLDLKAHTIPRILEEGF